MSLQHFKIALRMFIFGLKSGLCQFLKTFPNWLKVISIKLSYSFKHNLFNVTCSAPRQN